MKRPIESDYTSQVAYTRALEAYCDSLAQPAQGPVAWTTMPDAADWDFVSGSKDPNGKLDGKWVPLYTTPQQRPWVGLTAEEVKHEWEVWRANLPRYVGFAKGIETKLKEKNFD